MNIWLVQTGESIPLDGNVRKIRTAVLADELTRRGHTVLWWASAFDHFSKKWISSGETEVALGRNLKVIALKGAGYKRNVSLQRVIDHRIIAGKFRSLAPKAPAPDVVVASLPSHDLAYEAVLFARKKGIPVVVDIRDPWPDIFLNHVPLPLRGIVKMLLHKDFLMAREAIRKADGLLAVSDTFMDWGLRYAARQKTPRDKVFYLGYKREPQGPSIGARVSDAINRSSGKFVVLFVGTLANYHDPSIVAECAKRLAGTDIVFIIAGEGEFFESVRRKTNGMPNIFLTGWVNQDEITALLRHSRIGICPTAEEVDLFPNKAFAYLSAGLPVVSAFEGDIKRLIDAYKIGLYYAPNNSVALAGCIKKLYDDQSLYKEMSDNAVKIFEERFDAAKICRDYAEYIERLVTDGRRN